MCWWTQCLYTTESQGNHIVLEIYSTTVCNSAWSMSQTLYSYYYILYTKHWSANLNVQSLMLTLFTSMNCTVRGQPTKSTPEMLTSRAPFQKVRKPTASVSFTASPGWDMLSPHLTTGRRLLLGWLEMATLAALTTTPEEMTCTPGSRYNWTVQLWRGSRSRNASSRDPGVGFTRIGGLAVEQDDVPPAPCRTCKPTNQNKVKCTRTKESFSFAIKPFASCHKINGCHNSCDYLYYKVNGTDMKLLGCLESLPLFLMVAIILIKNAEWQSCEGKSDCATLLPPQKYTRLWVQIFHWALFFTFISPSYSPFFLFTSLPHACVHKHKHAHTMHRTLHKITTTYNHHHHTVQVAKCAHVHVCT